MTIRSRVKREKKTDPRARPVVAPEQETAAAVTQRDRIAEMYGHRVPPYSVRKQLREATLAVGRESFQHDVACVAHSRAAVERLIAQRNEGGR